MFVAVDGEVVGTGVVECWGFPVPGVVALWAFYFEDCGAEVCEPHGAVGSGENSGEVCDGDTFEDIHGLDPTTAFMPILI